MNIISKNFLMFVVFMMTLFSTMQVYASKKVVAVMPLENISDYNKENISEIMTEQLIDVIHNSGQYRVLETTQIGLVLQQQGFENLVSNQAIDFGNKTGSDYTVVGKIILAQTADNVAGIIGLITGAGLNSSGKSDAENGIGLLGQIANFEGTKGKVELQVRFVDNKTGEIVLSKTFGGEKNGKNSKTALISACKEAAETFLKEIQSLNPLSARVADIDGENIYIDQGSESGLQVGEVLMISREIDPIIVNGKVVGMKNISVCTATVIEVYSNYSICHAAGSNYLIKKGDIVKRS